VVKLLGVRRLTAGFFDVSAGVGTQAVTTPETRSCLGRGGGGSWVVFIFFVRNRGRGIKCGWMIG